MCTAITFNGSNPYFGRNLDFEHGFGECITITPRNHPLPFRKANDRANHYAMIGMAVTDNTYPLYFDATNEYGLSMAGLYFPDNAVYLPEKEGVDNITPFEFIPWILSQCKTIQDAKSILQKTNLINIAYSQACPLPPLHWIIADSANTITVEPTVDGLKIFDNPIGVLTNNPPFPYHLYNLSNYINLTREEPTNRFAPEYEIKIFSRGMGAIGLPGDLSSASRFVRASFVKLNSTPGSTEEENVSQFFHILGAVEQPKGCVYLGEKEYEVTIYSCCCDMEKGIYYWKEYGEQSCKRESIEK